MQKMMNFFYYISIDKSCQVSKYFLNNKEVKNIKNICIKMSNIANTYRMKYNRKETIIIIYAEHYTFLLKLCDNRIIIRI